MRCGFIQLNSRVKAIDFALSKCVQLYFMTSMSTAPWVASYGKTAVLPFDTVNAIQLFDGCDGQSPSYLAYELVKFQVITD